MKFFKYIITPVILLAFLTSCSDWLDVSPRSESREQDLYSNEDGFKSALIGVYIQLAGSNLYGKNTTMYFPEALSRHWTIPVSTTNTLTAVSNFDYTNSSAETLISSIWKNYYAAIAQLNNINANIQNSQVVFNYGNKELIEGEILGLRAFLHLDLLRYFAPVPSVAQLSDEAIPYVTEMNTDQNNYVSLTYGEVLEKITEDLDNAEKLLANDPIISNSNTVLNSQLITEENKPKDTWQLYRQNRFNYYAVLATKARLYHWIGDTDNAVYYAKKVIEAINNDSSPKFTLATEQTYTGTDANLIMFSENIFGVHNPDHQNIVEPLFKAENATLTQSVEYLNTAYESSLSVDDIRYRNNRYWKEEIYQNSAKTNHFFKYIGNGTINPLNIIPIIRLSEIYFILIEHLESNERFNYFNEFRIARNLNSSLDNEITNESMVVNRLEKEYRKEFFGEGQMFFFYKKHAYLQYTWPTPFTLPSLNAYAIPKPKK